MKKTTNYDLNQWDAEDRVTREDFNADNAAIDAALKANADAAAGGAEIVFGTYTGDGSIAQHITLGRQPKIVFVEPRDGIRNAARGALATIDHQARATVNGNSDTLLSLDGTGFFAYYTYYGTTIVSATNQRNEVYFYLAIF